MPKFTYNPILLGSTNASASMTEVRLLVGDTDSTDPQLWDDEITYLIDRQGSVRSAAVAACETLAAKYARRADKQVGDLRVSASQRSKAYHALADRLSLDLSLTAIPSAGGISIADKQSTVSDTDRVVPGVSKGWAEPPGSINELLSST